MKITVMTADEQIISLDVDPHETVENVKALLEVETRVLLQNQQLLYNGKEVRNSEKLSALGVRDDDLMMMVSNGASSAPSNALSFNPDGSAANPGAFQQHIRNDNNLMAQLFQASTNPFEDVTGFQVSSDKLVQDLIYHVELAKGSYKDNTAALARNCMLRESNVLKFVKNSSIMRPGYYIGIDKLSAPPPPLQAGTFSRGVVTMRCDISTCSSSHISLLVSALGKSYKA